MRHWYYWPLLFKTFNTNKMEQNKTHWKKLQNPDYIGAYSLMETGKAVDMTVTIKSVSRKTVVGADGKKEECTVAELVGQKPFIINATNAKTITKLYDTPFIEDWCGKSITLFVAKVRIAGETVDALRIRPTVPPKPAVQLPELTPQHEKWEGAKNAIKNGTYTLNKLKQAFYISDENIKLLTDGTDTTVQN